MNFLSKYFPKQKQPSFNTGFYSAGSIPPDYSDYLNAYETVGWWHAVNFRIALGMSEVCWTLHDVSNKEKPVQVYDSKILDLLNLLNPFQTKEEFIALHSIYMESGGEAFWVLNFNANDEPREAVLAYPNMMSVVPDRAFPFVKGYVYGTGANAVPLDVNQVIHFKYPNPSNQFRGLGQAAAIGTNLSAEKNADKWVNQFFYNSARPDGVLQFDYNLSDEQFDKLKKQWSEKYKGVNKAHQVALLEGGGKYVQIQNTVKDMDFPNLKQKNRDVILGVEGMPLSVMGISENVNLANAQAGDYTFSRWIIKPRLNWMLSKLNEQLKPKFKGTDNLKLGFEEIVPETAEQKRLDAESGIRAGYITVNEARKSTGHDAIPNGDVLLIQMATRPIPISGEIPQPEEPEIPDETPEEEPEEVEESITQSVTKGLTSEQKREHWESYARKTEKQELLFQKIFNKVYTEQRDYLSSQYETFQKLVDLNDEDTAKKFKPVIEMVYLTSYEEASKQFDLLDEYALEWIESRSLTLAKSINQTTLEAIRAELALGFTAGESIPQLVNRIKGWFDTSEKWRATAISRTEIIAASNESSLHRYENESVNKVEWYTAPGSCPECDIENGKIIATKDAHGLIPKHVNCRCVWLSVLE